MRAIPSDGADALNRNPLVLDLVTPGHYYFEYSQNGVRQSAKWFGSVTPM